MTTLLDDYIFSDVDDDPSANSNSGDGEWWFYDLTLVNPVEQRIGNAQGSLLASLLRLSILLLSELEPCSLKFREACSRLRCLFHWTLEVIRESVVVGGYTAAFQELTANLDRLVLSVVLHAHRALGKISRVAQIIEAPGTNLEELFPSYEEGLKNRRRLFLSAMELREIVLEAFRRRSEVLRDALSLEAYEALQAGLEDRPTTRRAQRRGSLSDINVSWQEKERGIRDFMANTWVQSFHGVHWSKVCFSN